MTEILCKAGVHIDNFKIDKKEHIKVFLLTHAHKDHAPKNIKTFQHNIYCSFLTATTIKHPKVFILQVDHWYDIEGISFYVLETVHCPGSLAFYFEKFGILHLGDTRVTTLLLQTIDSLQPKIIFYDNTHQSFRGMFPSLETSAIMLQQAIDFVITIIESKSSS